MKKHLLLGIIVSILLSACAKFHAPNDPGLTMQDRNQKSMQCHELKRMMATGTATQAKAAYRESKGLECGQ